ncbi:hypothetical protein BC828DRAFT_392291 [Blastocladiella britannica]|nr:hypothetical protein BC828DRAFT_392291 [Blastocladiella britannica]
MAWRTEHGFLDEAISHGRVSTLEWFSTAMARASNISIDWTMRPWDCAAEAGHTRVLMWAIAHGHFNEILPYQALLSTRDGDSCVMDYWVTKQQSKEAAMAALNDERILIAATKGGALKALDWWWAYTGSKLPEPTMFAKIADAALAGHSLAVVEWWWARFLEHRTPQHVFGDELLEIGSFKTVDTLDWHWQHYHETKELLPTASGPDNADPHGLIFTMNGQTTLPILQWAIEKCKALDGQKLKLTDLFIGLCIRDGHVDQLDLALNSADVLDMDWPSDLVHKATLQGQANILEWWDRNQEQLLPQDWNQPLTLHWAAGADAVETFTWWQPHLQHMTKYDRWKVCTSVISSNARCVQVWLHDHLDLFASVLDRDRHRFDAGCVAALGGASPYTLDFFATITPDMDPSIWSPIPKEAFGSLTVLFWACSRADVTIDSLLPLKPSTFEALLRFGKVTIAEWLLQKHLAAGHPLLLPPVAVLDDILRYEQSSRLWVHDVVITRKAVVLVESDSGMVPYELEAALLLQ